MFNQLSRGKIILDQKNCHQFINAKKINLGINIEIGEGTIIKGPDGPSENVEIGDNVFLDDNIFIMAPEFRIGDYSKIYNNCRISGYNSCIIGHNFWCESKHNIELH